MKRRQREAVEKYRELKRGGLKAEAAMMQICREYEICRRTLMRWNCRYRPGQNVTRKKLTW